MAKLRQGFAVYRGDEFLGIQRAMSGDQAVSLYAARKGFVSSHRLMVEMVGRKATKAELAAVCEVCGENRKGQPRFCKTCAARQARSEAEDPTP